MTECAVRECWIIAPGEDAPVPLRIAFHAPEQVDEWTFTGRFSIECSHFRKELEADGVDSMQALLFMPFKAHAYLCYRRRMGYQIYWFQPGDFDARFWGLHPAAAENPKTAGFLLRLARRLKLARPA